MFVMGLSAPDIFIISLMVSCHGTCDSGLRVPYTTFAHSGLPTGSRGQLNIHWARFKRAGVNGINRGCGLRALTIVIICGLIVDMKWYTGMLNTWLTWMLKLLSTCLCGISYLIVCWMIVHCYCVFLLGLGSRVLRGAGKGKGRLNQPWVGELWGRGVHCQLLGRHGRGIVQGRKPKMYIFPLEWLEILVTLRICCN